MKVTRKSTITGNVNTMEIDITPEQLAAVENRAEPIQNIVPDLPKEQREFLISGSTPEEWKELFGNPDEDENT